MRKPNRTVAPKRNSGCSVKLLPGSCLTDMRKTTWLVGSAIGAGAFGDIYLVSQNLDEPVPEEAAHVAKVEPIASGPLFVEMNFYLRAGRQDKIEKWQKDRELVHLGMPYMSAFGNQSYNGDKFRFLVIPRYGEDIASLFNRYDRKFSLKTVINIGLQTIDILEYIHYNGYVHADVKGANLVLGYGSEHKNRVYLVDYGLAITFVDRKGEHKAYGQDRRRAHDGTLEYTSRDAHIGAHSRRGDLETLGYNLIEWLSGKLPWAMSLHDPDEVAATKNVYMANLTLFMVKCFPHYGAPAVIKKYLEYINTLKFTTEPDYRYLRSVFTAGLNAANLPNDGTLEFGQVSQNENERRQESQYATDNDVPTAPILKQSPRNLRSLQVPKRQTRLGSQNNNSNFDWVSVIQSNPEREAKLKKTKEENASKPVVCNVDPVLRQASELIGVNPTPAMSRVILRWLLHSLKGYKYCNKAKASILLNWFLWCRSTFDHCPASPSNWLSNESRKKYLLLEERVRHYGVYAFSMLCNKKQSLFCDDGHTSSRKNDDKEWDSEDDQPLGRPPPSSSPAPKKKKDKDKKKKVTMAPSPRKEKRSRPRRSFRSTPARRQRSVTPFDTFYTPYRGPMPDSSRSPSPSPPRNRRSPRKRGRPRKVIPGRDSPRRDRRSPSPRRTRGRPRVKSRERPSTSTQDTPADREGSGKRVRRSDDRESPERGRTGKRVRRSDDRESPERERKRFRRSNDRESPERERCKSILKKRNRQQVEEESGCSSTKDRPEERRAASSDDRESSDELTRGERDRPQVVKESVSCSAKNGDGPEVATGNEPRATSPRRQDQPLTESGRQDTSQIDSNRVAASKRPEASLGKRDRQQVVEESVNSAENGDGSEVATGSEPRASSPRRPDTPHTESGRQDSSQVDSNRVTESKRHEASLGERNPQQVVVESVSCSTKNGDGPEVATGSEPRATSPRRPDPPHTESGRQDSSHVDSNRVTESKRHEASLAERNRQQVVEKSVSSAENGDGLEIVTESRRQNRPQIDSNNALERKRREKSPSRKRQPSIEIVEIESRTAILRDWCKPSRKRRSPSPRKLCCLSPRRPYRPSIEILHVGRRSASPRDRDHIPHKRRRPSIEIIEDESRSASRRRQLHGTTSPRERRVAERERGTTSPRARPSHRVAEYERRTSPQRTWFDTLSTRSRSRNVYDEDSRSSRGVSPWRLRRRPRASPY